MSTDKWHISRKGKIYGPFTVTEIHILLRSSQFDGADLVSNNEELWEPASQVPHLIPESILPPAWEPNPTPQSEG